MSKFKFGDTVWHHGTDERNNTIYRAVVVQVYGIWYDDEAARYRIYYETGGMFPRAVEERELSHADETVANKTA